MKVEELWIYPVKACQGVRVKSAALTPTGFENDRAWCVVDEDGTNVSKLEACSGRKLPALARVSVSFSADGKELYLDAEGMDRLAVPVGIDQYSSMADIKVECSGKSTTAASAGNPDSGWSFGFIACKRHPEGSAWLTKFLNTPDEETGGKKRNSGKTKESSYALCRSMTQGLKMTDYPPIFPVIAKAVSEPKVPDFVERFRGNAKRFADFAPVLLVNRSSAVDLGRKCAADKKAAPGGDPALARHGGDYPLRSFRGNIVVGSGGAAPWEEESWAEIVIGGGSSSSSGLTLKRIKACPRCTVPCREAEQGPHAGKFLFDGDSLRMWRVLKRAFPRKYDDPEWGSWSGAFFGIYFGNNGVEGEVREGDTIEVTRSEPWDAHLPSEGFLQKIPQWQLGAAAAAAVAVVAVVAWQLQRKSR